MSISWVGISSAANNCGRVGNFLASSMSRELRPTHTVIVVLDLNRSYHTSGTAYQITPNSV